MTMRKEIKVVNMGKQQKVIDIKEENGSYFYALVFSIK